MARQAHLRISPQPAEDLTSEQEKTLTHPALKASLILRMMYMTMDLIYGKGRSLMKFKSLEVLARYPYQAWENSSYHRLTRRYARNRYTKKEESDYLIEIIAMGRKAQDNEQWHMMIMEDLMRQKEVKQGIFRAKIAPRVLAFVYLGLTRAMYALNPKWSFSMNARFESHAEQEYMLMAKEHPEWEGVPLESDYFQYYPKPASLADLFRRIGMDERTHKEESMAEYQHLAGHPLNA